MTVKNKRTVAETSLVIILSLVVVLLIVGVIYFMTPKEPYFKTFHFDFWKIDYPTIEPIEEYIEGDSAFMGDRFDYIVYPNNDEVNSIVKSFINKTDNDITSKGIANSSEIDVNEIFNLLLQRDEDKITLENRIEKYGDFKYWAFQGTNRIMAIYQSADEILFLFCIT